MSETILEIDDWNRYSLLFLRFRLFGCLATPFICLIMQSEWNWWAILVPKAFANNKTSQNGIQLRSTSIENWCRQCLNACLLLEFDEPKKLHEERALSKVFLKFVLEGRHKGSLETFLNFLSFLYFFLNDDFRIPSLKMWVAQFTKATIGFAMKTQNGKHDS